MINASEVMTLKDRQRQIRTLAAAMLAVAASGVVTPLAAQQRRGPTATTPRFVVVNFRSADKTAGVAAASALRERLQKDNDIRKLWVIPKKDLDATLTNSGYPTDEALSATDARQLASLLRADEYVDGVVTPTPEGQFKVDARLVLSRDNALAQPLPSQVVGKPGDAAKALSDEIERARKAVPAEKECVSLARQKKFPEAIAEARKGIAEYANSTLARICLANVMSEQKAPADSILAVTQEILKLDPRSRPALRLAYTAYQEKGNDELAIETLTQLLAADPGNLQLQDQVVNELGRLQKFDRAVPIIDTALAENPGDPQLLNTGFKVFAAAEQWKKAIKAGEDLALVDTAAVDVRYFTRLAAAYAADSQPQLASQTIAKGTAKFPTDGDLWVVAAQLYRQAGQLQQAKEALMKAASIDPKAEGVNGQLAQLYADANQPDSAVAALQRAQAAGDSLAPAYALQLAQSGLRAAQASKSRDDFLAVRRYAEFSDRANPSKEAAFFNGAAAYSILASAAAEAQQGKNCELAQLAQQQVPVVSSAMARGGAVSPEFAKQAMGFVQEYGPAIDQMAKAYCK